MATTSLMETIKPVRHGYVEIDNPPQRAGPLIAVLLSSKGGVDDQMP